MEIIVRATVVYFFLWIVLRGIGKRELGEMSPFDLVLLVVIGDLVQQGVTQDDASLTGAMLSVGTFAFWVVVFAFVQFKSVRARRLVNGTAAIVVRDGTPVEEVLHLQRVSLDDLRMAARQKGIADLRDVELAVLEPEGRFSFIQRSRQAPDDEDDQATV